MTQLLISVKDVEESKIARHAGADLIDLKDPDVGALGALNLDIVKQIVQDIDGSTSISATVGEMHASVDDLMQDIRVYAGLGVDIVKIALTALVDQPDFFKKISELTHQGIQVVAVFFANQPLDFALIPKLKESGFYGAMIDTQLKQSTLLSVQPIQVLARFVTDCHASSLVAGLAGSVNKTHLDELLTLRPNFIGMRGGVCVNHDRTAGLMAKSITEVKDELLTYQPY